MDPGAPIAFKRRSRTRLRSPLGALRVWWSAGISVVRQITRRFKRRFYEAVGRATSCIEKLFAKKQAHNYLLALWNGYRKLTEASNSTTN